MKLNTRQRVAYWIGGLVFLAMHLSQRWLWFGERADVTRLVLQSVVVIAVTALAVVALRTRPPDGREGKPE